MNYGARARDWIIDHDIKQKVLAKEFHITEANMSNYLRGRTTISVDILVKIAKRFDLSMDYLVGLTDTPERPMELSATERAMVTDFRALSYAQQEILLNSLQFMVRQNQQK